MPARNRKKTIAQGLVEFALVAPLFFTMTFGFMEGARLVWTYHTLTNATKEGSRYALVRGSKSDLAGAPATTTGVKTHMLTKSTGLGADSLSVTVSYPDGNNDPKSRVTIDSSYTFNFVASAIFGVGTLNLTASSEAIIAH